MKMKKINWVNVIKLIIFIFCIGMILHDIYMLTIHGWITCKQAHITIFGLITFILFSTTSLLIYIDFDSQIQKKSMAGTNRQFK